MGDVRENNTASMQKKSLAMNGGNGTNSYSKNSTVQFQFLLLRKKEMVGELVLQREACMHAKTLVEEVISEKLEVQNLLSTASDRFCIADLGCSVGPNTIMAMENVIEAVEKKFQSEGLNNSDIPEFIVFLNDQATNDFNTLFACLPPEKNYFVAGIPGSFHGQLFPRSSIHIAHSSFALHWLSEIPKEVLRRNSAAWNKGRIFYTSAPEEVGEAYAAQFARDIETFLNARAKEMVAGGLLLILISATPDNFHRSQTGSGFIYDALGASLMDMASEGVIREDQVDSFNLPIYVTNRKEMKAVIENNGSFGIERMELTEFKLEISGPLDTEKHVSHIRAAMEGIIAAHFGEEIIDDLFCRFNKRAKVLKNLDEKYRKGTLLFLALKCK